MYVCPGFDLLTIEAVDEDSLGKWAVENGAAWHPIGRKWMLRKGETSHPHNPICHFYAEWRVLENQRLYTISVMVSKYHESEAAEYRDQINGEIVGSISVDLHRMETSTEPAGASRVREILRSLSDQWNGYPVDIGYHQWVTNLLEESMPNERILRFRNLR